MVNWYEYPRWRDEYENGLDKYIDDAFATRAQGGQISCPCEKYCYRYWIREKNVVTDHVISNGFVPRSDQQQDSHVNVEVADDVFDEVYAEDDIDGLLNDTLGNDSSKESKMFYKLMEEGQQELYPGCKNFSKLSFTIRLLLFKCDNKLSNNAFNDLLALLRAMLPESQFPSSYNEARKVLKGLGLTYLRIDACPNDCMLYWEDYAEATYCHICKTPRWKPDERAEKNGKQRKIPCKVLRYFPVKKRLQRLYMCARTATDMTWHSNGRAKDNLLRHPADGKSWKDFDLAFPKFAEEPRNVRLGLSTDGFNPFSTMSISHSTWPVILMNYNLPPWMCMKPEFFMLALIIPGPQSPGNDIDVYMQPLIKELNELWEFGLDTYDASSKQIFKMHAALLFTISDFPAYSMLSGWSTKGKKACPNCHYETCSEYLKNSQKHCYMGHERFSAKDHVLRDNTDSSMEESVAPTRLKGDEIVELLADFENYFGKTEENKKKNKKRAADGIPWRKMPIFFKLPYWKSISCCHYLDVMHIEKTKVCCKVINPEDLEQMQSDVVKTLCELERIFPPSFFDVMVHLTVHLVEEIKLGGPPFSKWMYPVERYLRILKSYVRNKSQPEGSIAEGYIAEECLSFCARYLSISNTESAEKEFVDNETQPVFPRLGTPIMGHGNKKKEYGAYRIDLTTWNQAHKYVLFNCDLEKVESYIKDHHIIVSQKMKRKWDSRHIHSRDFAAWFKEKVQSEILQGEEVLEHIKWLSRGHLLLQKNTLGTPSTDLSFTQQTVTLIL